MFGSAFDNWKAGRIVINPNILGGEPVFRGSRLSVRHIGLSAAREPISTVREDYPYLSSDDVRFAIQYAALPSGK